MQSLFVPMQLFAHARSAAPANRQKFTFIKHIMKSNFTGKLSSFRGTHTHTHDLQLAEYLLLLESLINKRAFFWILEKHLTDFL